MCNARVIEWFDQHLTRAECAGARVLEVGSRNVNGSVRAIFQGKGCGEYLGIDIEPGPGVDRVCDVIHLLGWFGQAAFDVVVSTCALEHIEQIQRAAMQMCLACKPDGLIILAVPGIAPRHDYPSDYWRFTAQSLTMLFGGCLPVEIEEQVQGRRHSVLFAKFRRPQNYEPTVPPLRLEVG